MNITITLQFADAAEAAEALNRLSNKQYVSPAVISHQTVLTPPAVIAPVDNPATGADTTNPFAPKADTTQVITTPVVNPFAAPALVAPAVQAPAVLSPPSAATVPTAAPTGMVLDSEGLPWDSRIHGETKTQNKDGTWRAKRGLNDGAMVQRVKAELLALVATSATTGAAPVLAPPPAVAPMLTPPVQPAPVVMAPPPEVAAAPLAPPPAATVATVPGAPVTFLQLFTLVNDATKAGKLSDDMVIAVLKPFGLGGVTQSASRPDLIPTLYAQFAAMVGA